MRPGLAYRMVDTVYHPILENYCRRFGYDDIFLVDADSGNVVASVMKKGDFGTNLLQGPYTTTGLAQAFRKSHSVSRSDFAALEDFAPYAASHFSPASFIASPVVENGRTLGVLIIQIPIAMINQVMTSENNWSAEGLGKTGETYIVGSDYTLRTDSRFFIQEPDAYYARLKKIGTGDSLIEKIKSLNTSILLQKVQTEATRDALQGKTATKIISDYRGINVLSSFTPLTIPGVDWVLVSEIDVSEALNPVFEIRERLILLGLVLLLLAALGGMLIAQTISKPILKLAKAADEFAEGNFSFRAEVRSADEIGLLASEFNTMAESILQTTRNLQNEIVERKRVEEQLLVSHQQLRNLSAHLQTVREEERKGLAREIHDELGQALTTLKLHLTVLKGDLQPVSSTAGNAIAPLLTLIDTTIQSVKRMIVALRPRLLDDLGLTAAIEWHVEEFQQRTGIRCSLAIEPAGIVLDDDRSIAIFRIIQETLSNIARHAQANTVAILLHQEEGEIRLHMTDDGIGITAEQATGNTSFGLIGIRERASYWGGEATISGASGQGTTVIVKIPAS